MKSKEMTQTEFYEKYGDVEVTFRDYYKYTFNFSTQLPDGKLLIVGYGGTHDDIYRSEITANRPEKVIDLQPYRGSVYDGNEEVEGFIEF